MKFFIYICGFLYLTSCTSPGVRAPAADKKGRHFVITLHGVRGNDKSYGDFHKIVKQNLEKLDAGYTVENFNWTFPVGAKVVETKAANGRDLIWTPHQISKKFNQDFFLSEKPLIPIVGPNDKISLIAYSMGGLMAMSWYYDTMFNFAGQELVKYTPDQHALLLERLEKVENVIGLGAVYWGSLDSELGWTFLENGQLAEIKKTIPKIVDFCKSASTQKVIEGQGLLSSAGSFIGGFFGKKAEPLSVQQKNEKFVKDSVLAACQAVKLADSNYVLGKVDSVPKILLNGIQSDMTSAGNVSPHELDNMRLTSDTINEMRIGRVKHVLNSELNNRFKARWTSIVGVFPCLGKADKGLTCSKFIAEDYKRVNDGLVTLFSGLYRRETDGPVISPSAVADFLFYIEPAGRENTTVTAEQFQNTNQLQQTARVVNKEIFVENMHATVTPALEALTGSFQSLGASTADAVKKFDDSLGVDVVIVNKECADPATCEHPNYKHILQALANCDKQTGTYCDHDFMNKFYRVSQTSARLSENNKLKEEMGSLVLTMNIRLPKNIQITEAFKKNILNNFKFSYVNHGSGSWGENRLDSTEVPYGLQMSRASEIMSSYATVKSYSDSQVLRVFFMGRAWAKPGKVKEAKQMLEAGVPLAMSINIPGVQPRLVTAKVKPSYTTYIDMFMK